MRTVSVRELKNNPSEALRDARLAPVLVLNHGRPEALLVAVGDPADAPGLKARLGEAAALVRELAGDGGARAARAVDLAVRPDRAGLRGHRADAAAAPNGAPDSPLAPAELARLVGSICSLCRPSRILLGSARELLAVCPAMPEPATRAALERAAMRAHATIVVARPEDAPATEVPWELVFEAGDAAVTTVDRLIAEGRARPPRRQGPFLMPAIDVPPGVDLPAILSEMREDRP